MPLLEEWAITGDFGSFVPPGTDDARLVGEVYEHPDHDPGKQVITSPIVKFNLLKSQATTFSGTLYSLGAIHEDFKKWMTDRNYTLYNYQKSLVKI